MESEADHVLIFPFMSKGHTVPLLHLSRLLLRHRPLRLHLTIFTTPANQPFISSFLLSSSYVVSSPEISIIPLPFPTNTTTGDVESTDKLPSMSLFPSFAASTQLLQPLFEDALRGLSNVKLLISDGFLPWTLQSAEKLNIPTLIFYGMNYSSLILTRVSGQLELFSEPIPDHEPVTVPGFPWVKLARNDLPYPFNMRDPSGPLFDLIGEMTVAEASSHGMLFNSFQELEAPYIDYWNANCATRAWSIGPLCLADGPEKRGFEHREARQKPDWEQWMDQMLVQGKKVLYVAFGTQAEVSSEQIKEITVGLERSEVNFMWVVRVINQEQEEIVDGLRNRVKERGLVVGDWVDQNAVLRHEAVHGFLSHSGWNSVTESVCAGLPMLAWPMMAEQCLNARMVVEEMGTGIRIETYCADSDRGVVKADALEMAVRELMEGEAGEKARKKAKAVGEAARKAMGEGGSSWLAMEDLLEEFHITN